MNPTNLQLKMALAKMLPEKSAMINKDTLVHIELFGKDKCCRGYRNEVLDSELEHLCWLVEEKLAANQKRRYAHELTKTVFPGWSSFPAPVNEMQLSWMEIFDLAHATPEQKIQALAKVLGIEIV